jgi:hypothetical protein
LLEGKLQSQIRVLNEDFRKKDGAPGFNNNPVGADVEMVLLQGIPSGVSTNGDRVNLGQASWSTD